MYTAIHPKLPMRSKSVTQQFYVGKLGFRQTSSNDYADYLMISKDNVEIHFFEFRDLDPKENYGQVYIRMSDIDELYRFLQDNNVEIHPAGHLQIKPWGQKEFSILDPDNNLLTFGEGIRN